ncbi:MAG: DsbA family protein [Actinomycetota bacterium]|nr:DsbA family protein [Actinomycetota bacterium]MDQ6949027.1 DsbA family protein [Actinomycetota bacterium]
MWSDVVCPWCYIGKRRFEAPCRGSCTGTMLTWCGGPLSSIHPRLVSALGPTSISWPPSS